MAKFAFDKFAAGQATGPVFVCSRGPSRARNSSIQVTAESGGFKVKTPYNAEFVPELKARIPGTHRKWDGPSKCWLVAGAYEAELKELIDRCYGGDVEMPVIIAHAPELKEITFQADYIGSCRDGNAASVHSGGNWSAKIPEKVLRAWFKQAADAGEASSFYGLLGLDQKALPADIKKAYKRAARQWHPDICKEPEGPEMFRKVKEAFDVLNDPITRARYNAGLAFEAMARIGGGKFGGRASKYANYIPMLRCGILRVMVTQELGGLMVQEILEWGDITNEYGQTMVSFWADDSFSVAWV